MKSILIPTDFKAASLTCIPDLCRQQKGEDLNLVFIHLFKVSDSITDLLMLNRRNREYEYISDDFYLQCEHIKASFPQIKHIKIDFFYGSTIATFRNYLEGNGIDCVLDLAHCNAQPLNKRSVDPQNLIQKSGLKTLTIEPIEITARKKRPVFDEELIDAV
jgi:hypothetical protein